MDKIIPLPLQRLVIFALALSLPLQQSTALTDLQCSTLSSSDLWTEASSVADKATEKLLADGRFERVVDDARCVEGTIRFASIDPFEVTTPQPDCGGWSWTRPRSDVSPQRPIQKLYKEK